jgi:hypothetical protein
MDANSAAYAEQVSGNLYAGEDIDAVAACHIGTDGLVYMSNGAAANQAAHFDGICPVKRLKGEPLTLYGPGTIFKYSDGGLTPGRNLYVAATKGRLDDAATTGDDQGVVRTINASHVRVIRFN